MKFLRTFINNIKPSFVDGGKYNKWFPLFDALENLFFTNIWCCICCCNCMGDSFCKY